MSNKVPNGWKECKLGEVIELLYGKGLREQDRKPGNIPVYGSNGIVGYHNEYLVKGPGIIIGRKGSVGEVKYSPADFFPIDTTYYVSLKEGMADIRFMYYFLLTLHIDEMNSHSAVPGLNRNDVYSLDVTFPPLPEQCAIASVLSSLDDKIDLLHRENKTLEAMAETLFRQWFIEEADEGWEEVKLGDFFPVVTGKKNANFATSDGSYPFFTCSQSVLKAPSYSFNGAAILLSGNGDFNIKHYIGKFEAYQRTYVLMPYDTLYFGFLLTLMKYYLFDITKGHQGSVIDFITKPMIEDFVFLLPKRRDLIKDKLVCFNDLYRKVDVNIFQIHTLEKLRDTLLPKLMSGEVRVKYEEEEMASCRA